MTGPSHHHFFRPDRTRILCAAAALGLAAGLTAACSEPAPPPPPPAPAMKSAEARVQWYQDCWSHYSNKAWDQFQTCYAETATSEGADSTDPPRAGRAAIIEFAKKETASFSDRRGEVKLVLGNGPRIASVALWTATNDGALPPGPDGKAMPATNKKVGVLMGHTIELDATGSHAVRDVSYFDEATMLAQLGVIKAPARPVMAPTSGGPTVVIARNDDTETRNVAAARAAFDAFNAHDLSAMEALLADNYRLIEIGAPADANKKESMASTRQFFTAFSDIRTTLADVWAAGDYVVATGTISGTNNGPFPAMGISKPTGKTVTARFLEIYKYENGKVVEDWLFYNGAAIAAQLGLQ